MNTNSRIVVGIAAALGALFVAKYAQTASHGRKRLVAKKQVKEAVHSWEGEGGAIIERAPRITS